MLSFLFISSKEKELIFFSCLVYRTVKLFLDMRAVSDRNKSGQPRVVQMSQVIKAVKSRINQNPVQKQKIKAREMDIALRTMSHVIK